MNNQNEVNTEVSEENTGKSHENSESPDLEKNQKEFEAQVKRALASNIHVPNWVDKNHVGLYKIAHTQVKEDNYLSNLPSADRGKAIRKLMTNLIKNINKEAMSKKGDGNDQKESGDGNKDISNETEDNKSHRF